MNKYTFHNQSGSISFQIKKKTILITLLLGFFTMLAIITALSIGSTMIHPLAVVKNFLGVGNGQYNFIITTLRLPRILLSLLVGAALGVAGLILQGIVRNPLASPDIIGITSGASSFVVLFFFFFSGALSIKWLPVAAIIGAAVVSGAIYIFAWQEGVSPLKLVLIGIGMSALMKALTTLLIVIGPITTTAKAYTWLTGSVYGANWEDVYSMLPWLIIFLPLALFFSRILNVQELGD